MKPVHDRREERGIVLILATVSLVMLVPMVGLSVDVGYLYAVKARLQAAVDGASLAAARALNLGATTAAQADAARQNAVNWFYSNFPPGNWATTNTVMNTGTVQVYDSPINPNLRHVDVSATTRVPTFFLKWFDVDYTEISAVGFSSRRDTVVMMVLDRSGSMNNTSSCGTLRNAAKLFVGQFAAGRDRIGMVSFSDGTGPIYPPTQNFRSVLGFTAGSSSGTGAIDNIVCLGGTSSAQAITIGYNELYKTNLPGAYNVLLFETDGLPNTLVLDWWDPTRADPNKSGLVNLGATTGCQDSAGRARGYPGWNMDSRRRNWMATGVNLGGFLGMIGPGMIGAMASSDPGGTSIFALANPFHSTQNMGLQSSTGGSTNSRYASTATPGCMFNSSITDVSDFQWIPRTDVFGNDVRPADNFRPVTMVDVNNNVTSVPANMRALQFTGMTTSARWQNFNNAALNASDHAAFRARQGVNGGIAATVFVIGLGGNATGAATPSYQLMQRWANDSRADQFNSPPLYPATTLPASFSSQPKGMLVFSSNQNDLRRAFLQISSQILRLTQ
jgi:Flp pilus assembly protein TadG